MLRKSTASHRPHRSTCKSSLSPRPRSATRATSSRPPRLKTVSARADRLTPPQNSVRISPRVTSTSLRVRPAHREIKRVGCHFGGFFVVDLKARGKPGGPQGARDLRTVCFRGHNAGQGFTRTAFA